MRKLAEHTASGTKEIAAVITQIQNDTTQALNLIQRSKVEVEAGRDLAGQAEVSLSQIIKAAREVDEIIAQVAAASQQQLTTSKNLAESTEIINQITQTNERSIAEMVCGSVDIEHIIQDLLTSLTSEGETYQAASSQKLNERNPKPKLQIVA